MAITQSLVRVYEDSLKQTLVGSWPGSSPNWTTIAVDELEEGKEYYATAQVTVDGIQSAESQVYRFYTLPDVSYFTQPVVSEGQISTQMLAVTEDVTVSYFGLQYATNSSFSPLTEVQGPQGGVDINNLAENTTYWVRPFVIDEYNRKWVNTSLTEQLTTPYAKPVVTWTGMAAVGIDTYQHQINIQSTAAITDVTVYYTDGSTTSSFNLQNQTGTQQISISGLTPNTGYSIYVKATNASGYTNSSTETFTTGQAQMAVEVTQAQVSNTNNIISVTSRATYDSSITLISNSVELWENNSHTGTAYESNTGSTDTYTNNLAHANPDETYYVFGHVTYTIGSDPTVLEAWSSPVTVHTYALLSFGSITTSNGTASIPYSVLGVPISDDIAYSSDGGTTWTTIPVPTLSGGTLTLSGLTPNTTYSLRGRCQSAAGWQAYVTTTFTTTNVLPVVTVSSVTNITTTDATVNLTIS